MCLKLGIGVHYLMRVNDMERVTVIGYLVDWAKWKYRSGEALGFPSMSSFMRIGSGPTPGERSYDDVDSWCVATNLAYKQLPPYLRNVVEMEYLSVYKTVAIKANMLRISKRTYHNRLNEAYDLLAKKLTLHLHSLHDSDTFLLNQLEMPQQA